MDEREPSPHVILADPEEIDLVLPGIGPDAVHALEPIAEAVTVAGGGIVVPLGIEIVQDEARVWVIGAVDRPPVIADADRPCDVEVEADRLDGDALRFLGQRALGVAAAAGSRAGWSEVSVPWGRVRLPGDVAGDSVEVEDRRDGGSRRLLCPVDRVDGAAWVVGPRNVAADGGAVRIGAPVELEFHPSTGPDGAATGIVLTIVVRWSTWWQPGSAGRTALEAMIDELERGGWRRRGGDAIRLGAISGAGQRAQEPPPIAAPPKAPFPVGATTDGGAFVVEEVLHRFGRGSVCRGVRRDDGTPVIVTVRAKGGATPEGASRRLGFGGECVANLLHVGTIDGSDAHLAVVEARPDGVALTELPWPVPLATVADVAARAATALDAAHDAGAVLHEIRPELVYVDTAVDPPRCAGLVLRPPALLLGFLTADDGETQAYPFEDTYLSPELVGGLAPSPASDAFSLSALLAHALSGVHPFTGVGVQRLVAIHGGDRSAWTGPPALGPVIDRALARDPGARASAAEVAAALRAALAPAPAVAPPLPPPPPPPAGAGLPTMQDVAAAMTKGEFARALDALGRTPEAGTDVGVAVGAYILALMGRFEEADQQVASVPAPAVRTLVRGQWNREARWRLDANANQLPTATPFPHLTLYVEMAVALLHGDVALADRVKADMAAHVPKQRGRITFVDGKVLDFDDLSDADDAIGAMLETYSGDGLLYFPFPSLRRIEFPPPRNIIDLLTPLAVLMLNNGSTASVAVPLLYAGSTTSTDESIRNGRMTTFDFVGAGRRALGHRDFVANGSTFIGMSRVASIDFVG